PPASPLPSPTLFRSRLALSALLWRALSPAGSVGAERCPLGTSAPQRGRRDLALRKLLAAHILGSPSGGAGAVRRLRGQAASLTADRKSTRLNSSHVS